MMITEHNCEDYFLLYVDNELSTAERTMVEAFLAQHPQHLTAFNALQATKLSSDNSISFFNKEALYKDETREIGINNYEEYFLLYTDDELNKEQKETTERFVLQHPQLQEEFTLLQQTKLAPDVIEYRNKEKLYKKERSVLPLYIAGLSVAAATLTLVFLSGLFAPNVHSDSTMVSVSVKKPDKPIKQPAQQQAPHIDVANQQEEYRQKNLQAEKTVNKKGEKNMFEILPTENHNRQEAQSMLPQRVPDEQVAVVAPNEETQRLQPEIPDNNTVAKQVSVLRPLDDDAGDETLNATALSLSDYNIAQPAVYKELDTDDDGHTLYVSALRLNKNKVNGFLKSASRLLGGRAKGAEQ